ncbi:hypothetical protein [uncultured Ornithinimicrobium sp.]|uniref:hypothetical protein n=1 Tax=uncultured Ornithinimicrobium sp. TaxID=259307 RepID=UPI002599AC2E|nr:hypothetical protein [uncultured Ornithinimicrobium sp.]
MPAAHPDPRGYPWAEPARPGVLGPAGFVEDAPDLQGRTPVVAVGSNASPTVLRAKLGGLLGTGLPMTLTRVEGLQIGHSAHVSARGYVAAAPVRARPGTDVGAGTFVVCWFDQAQLARVDGTEPNYRRVRLDRTGERTAAQVYTSVHGVLGEGGTPLDLLDQGEVLDWLAARLGPGLREDLDHRRLTDPAVRERVRTAMVEAGLVIPAGW